MELNAMWSTTSPLLHLHFVLLFDENQPREILAQQEQAEEFDICPILLLLMWKQEGLVEWNVSFQRAFPGQFFCKWKQFYKKFDEVQFWYAGVSIQWCKTHKS